MSSLRTFLYRFPRFEANHHIDFVLEDKVLLGLCLAISESGLHCTLSDAVPPGTKGLLTVYRDGTSFSAHAVTLESHGEETTAMFAFASAQEQTAIRELLKLLVPHPAS